MIGDDLKLREGFERRVRYHRQLTVSPAGPIQRDMRTGGKKERESAMDSRNVPDSITFSIESPTRTMFERKACQTWGIGSFVEWIRWGWGIGMAAANCRVIFFRYLGFGTRELGNWRCEQCERCELYWLFCVTANSWNDMGFEGEGRGDGGGEEEDGRGRRKRKRKSIIHHFLST